MRRWAPVIGIVLTLVAASLAAAQAPPRPRVTVVIQAPASASATAKPAAIDQPALRKPFGPAIAPAGAAAQSSLSLSLALAAPRPKGGLAFLKGLNSPSASAQAAQCRAQCSEARYICTARDAGDCDTAWGECVVRCSGANYTETPDLAFSAAYRPGP